MQGAQSGKRNMLSPSGGKQKKSGQGNLQRLERAKVRAKEKTEATATAAMAKERAKDGKDMAAVLAKERAKARIDQTETRERGKAKAMTLGNVIIVGSGGISEQMPNSRSPEGRSIPRSGSACPTGGFEDARSHCSTEGTSYSPIESATANLVHNVD